MFERKFFFKILGLCFLCFACATVLQRYDQPTRPPDKGDLLKLSTDFCFDVEQDLRDGKKGNGAIGEDYEPHVIAFNCQIKHRGKVITDNEPFTIAYYKDLVTEDNAKYKPNSVVKTLVRIIQQQSYIKEDSLSEVLLRAAGSCFMNAEAYVKYKHKDNWSESKDYQGNITEPNVVFSLNDRFAYRKFLWNLTTLKGRIEIFDSPENSLDKIEQAVRLKSADKEFEFQSCQRSSRASMIESSKIIEVKIPPAKSPEGRPSLNSEQNNK